VTALYGRIAEFTGAAAGVMNATCRTPRTYPSVPQEIGRAPSNLRLIKKRHGESFRERRSLRFFTLLQFLSQKAFSQNVSDSGYDRKGSSLWSFHERTNRFMRDSDPGRSDRPDASSRARGFAGKQVGFAVFLSGHERHILFLLPSAQITTYWVYSYPSCLFSYGSCLVSFSCWHGSAGATSTITNAFPFRILLPYLANRRKYREIYYEVKSRPSIIVSERS
jgi:hypothetical protein